MELDILNYNKNNVKIIKEIENTLIFFQLTLIYLFFSTSDLNFSFIQGHLLNTLVHPGVRVALSLVVCV